MRNMTRWMVGATLALLIGGTALAADFGTADEAVAMVKKAIVHYKADGRDKIIVDINRRDGIFVDKDLYLIVSGLDGKVVLAHGNNPRLVGKDISMLKDADGILFTQQMTELANSKAGKGWVNYKWPRPGTTQIEQKSAYVERIDDLIFSCGIYKH